MPIHVRPRGVDAVPRLGREAIELIAIFPEEIGGLLRFSPGQLDIAHSPFIPVLRAQRDAVIIWAHERIRTDNHVWQIRRRLRTFTMHDKVFTATNGRWIVAVRMEPSR